MNLFTQNSPYYHLLKYLLFLLKRPVYILLIRETRIYVTINNYNAEFPVEVILLAVLCYVFRPCLNHQKIFWFNLVTATKYQLPYIDFFLLEIMFCHVVIGSGVLKEIIAFTFEDQWVQTHCLLNIKAVGSSATSDFLYPLVQGHIPEEPNPQLYLCEKIHNPHTLYNLWNPKLTVDLYKFEVYHKIQSRFFFCSKWY